MSNKFYIKKTSRCLKIRYDKYVSEIKLKKSFSKYNFTKHVLKVCIQYWKNFHIHNEIKYNSFVIFWIHRQILNIMVFTYMWYTRQQYHNSLADDFIYACLCQWP